MPGHKGGLGRLLGHSNRVNGQIPVDDLAAVTVTGAGQLDSGVVGPGVLGSTVAADNFDATTIDCRGWCCCLTG